MQFKPLWDYLLVKPLPRSRSDVLTIITAEQDHGSIGARSEVVAIGQGKPNKRGIIIPNDGVSIGDIVWYGGERLGCIKYPKVRENGVDYECIQLNDIMFVEDAD